MPRGLSANYKSKLNASDGRLYTHVLFAMELDTGDVRMWDGIGDLDYDGNTYTGVGNFGGILGELNEPANLSTPEIQGVLSGTSATLIAQSLSENYQGREVHIYFAELESDQKTLTADDYVEEVFQGQMEDYKPINLDGPNPYILVTMRSTFARLEVVNLGLYTDADWKIKHSGDEFFSFVESMNGRDTEWRQR